MEFHEEEFNKSPENKEELDENDSNAIDTSFETHFMKLEEILRNKNNRENILKHASDNLQIYKQILIDQTKSLKETQEKNQHLSLKIKYENQWRDKIIKRMIQTYDKLKIVTSSTNSVKSIITSSENTQEKINQGKRQLMERISFNKENDDLKYEQLIHEDDLLSEKIKNEKLNMKKFERQFEIEFNEVCNKICLKKQSVNNSKIKIGDLKIANQLIEKKINAVVSEKDLVLKEIDVINLKTNNLQETVEKDIKEYDEKIKSLNNSLEININCINNLEKNTDVIEEEINNENEILNKMYHDKSELKQNLLNIEMKHSSYDEECSKLKDIYDLEVKEYDRKTADLKEEINDGQNKTIEIEKKNSLLKEDHHALVNQIMSLESGNNQLDLRIAQINDDLIGKHFSFKENENSFEESVTKLKEDLEEIKNVNETIENDIGIIENEMEKLNIEHEKETIAYDNVFNEVSTKEIDLNLEIDRLNETKHLLESEVGETKTKITALMQRIEEELQRAQHENDLKIKNLEEQTNIYQKETEKVHQVNGEKRKQEHNKLKENDNSLKLKISECQIMKQKLDNELAVRIKELGKIREKKEAEVKERRENEFLQEADMEVMNENIMSTPISKKSANNLPNLKIPDSKYSSTSFSDDSSIASLDSTTSLKNKLQKQKRLRQTLPTKAFPDTQKSLDEIFNSLRDGPTDQQSTKVKKPKTTRKTIF